MSARLWVREEWVNKTEGYRAGDSDVYETSYEDRAELYRAMVREYGRCLGRCYADHEDGSAQPIGWVFLKRARYEDTGAPYLLETWVTVHEGPPTRSVEYHYAA